MYYNGFIKKINSYTFAFLLRQLFWIFSGWMVLVFFIQRFGFYHAVYLNLLQISLMHTVCNNLWLPKSGTLTHQDFASQRWESKLVC